MRKKKRTIKNYSTSKDTLNPNGTFVKEYSLELVRYVNSAVMPEERDIFKELYDAVKEANHITNPSDLLMLDMAIFDYLRAKRVQKVLSTEGVTITFTSKSGKTYTKAHEANYLLNSIETQFRNLMKEIGVSGKERFKKQLGVEAQDFSNFMSETVVDAEIVEDNDSTE